MVELTNDEQEFMRKKIFATIGVISPTTGLPHLTTVWAHYQDGKFYIITRDHRAKYRFINQGSNKVGLNLFDPKGYPYLSINGEAKIIRETDKEDFWDTIITIIKQYNSGDAINQWLSQMKEAGDRVLIEIDPINKYSSV